MNSCLPFCGLAKPKRQQQGFTLLEVAMVLLIMALLLASVLRPFGAQLEQRQRDDTMRTLLEVREAIVGFVAANHRLPCPAAMGASLEGDCSVAHGFVPAAALGIDGAINEDGALIDAWNNPVRYSVSVSDVDADGQPDFTTVLEMRDIGMQYLRPEFEVCADTSACARLRANRIPVVLVSTGANGNSVNAGTDERENLDGNERFVSRDIDRVGDDQFDDIVVWLSGNILYSKMIQAGVLP